jgi:hypothetical protein
MLAGKKKFSINLWLIGFYQTFLTLSNFWDKKSVEFSSIKMSYFSVFFNFQIPTGEDEEEVLLSMRAKLFRYDHCADPKEWKERGTGESKEIQVLIRIS